MQDFRLGLVILLKQHQEVGCSWVAENTSLLSRLQRGSLPGQDDGHYVVAFVNRNPETRELAGFAA
jgi:hypothetical protein